MAPQIRYAHTSDGVSIAYFVVGSGPLLINLPAPPFGNVELSWRIDEFRVQVEAAAQRVTFAQYDPRGFGMSDRDISDFSLDALTRDLEAVTDALGHGRFAIATWDQFAMPVLAYAAEHPERVIAIVLREGYARGSDADWNDLPLDLARENWDLFIRALADRTINITSVTGLAMMHQLMRQTAARDTFIRYVEHWQTWDVVGLLDHVTMPVLVINDSRAHREASRTLAAALPRGSLVSNDVPRGAHSPSEDAFRAFLTQAFVAEAAATGPVEAQTLSANPGLSPREIEVLKLIVEGKSGKEIAARLVLSPRTVERHVANIYRKTETHGRAQLASFALRQKLV